MTRVLDSRSAALETLPKLAVGLGESLVPSKDGKLSFEETSRIVEKLNAYEAANGRELACDVCGSTLWFVNDVLLGMHSDSPLGPIGSKHRTPAVSLHCTGCGQMKLFAAKQLGVEPLKGEPEEVAPNGN